jgi:uncharacterized protein
MSIAERWRRFRELPPDILLRLNGLAPLLKGEGVLLAYLFGSLARHDQGQDVDLALLAPAGQPPFRLRGTIVDHLGTERLDIVDLRRATPALAFEIISSARILYAAAEEQRLTYELAVLRQYKDTAHLRRQQEQILRRRLEAWSLNVTV